MELLTIDEVSERYRVPKATLRFWRHKGEGPKSFLLGRRVVYKQSDCDAWVEQQYAAADRPVVA
ncbi:helix-turn-helix domain-containing protein [Modestobacter sp. VKM Ac-2983]|uniref:helix-turn-helix transcriptional regulator n=1 Tax=Modestobacter sp. VKM Ac-2983 TaxID=3004137 RepID=UPI0022AB4FCD|nr:helix-turn-helix domain-containing protein [Modestobacter sp. VKM Ac-2983]MCZ2804332.1 helix-turn-helix domain-containing protein [Modestobacter sp. VKM Ac-2983]